MAPRRGAETRMTTYKRRTLLQALGALAACGGLLGLQPAMAASFPDHPITLIVPYPAGGSADLAGRTAAKALEGVLGQTVVVENRAGAGGNIGIGALARSKADGYTIGLSTIGPFGINPFLYKELPFDPDKDFEPIAMVLTTPNVIAVRADSPYKTLADLVKEGKSRDKDHLLSYGTPGVGSSLHLTGVQLEQATGMGLLHVPFKGVSASMPALIGGQIDILMDNLPSTLSHVQSADRIRALAVTSADRVPVLPDVPTVAESGYPDVKVTSWFALYAPAGTPADVMKTLVDASRKAMVSPELEKTFTSQGGSVGNLFGQDLADFGKQERQRWGALIKERHISVNK